MRRNSRSHRITDFFSSTAAVLSPSQQQLAMGATNNDQDTSTPSTDLSQSSMSQSLETVGSTTDLVIAKGQPNLQKLTEAFNSGKSGRQLHAFFTKKRPNSTTINAPCYFSSEAPLFPIHHAVPVDLCMQFHTSRGMVQNGVEHQHRIAVPYAQLFFEHSSAMCDQLQCPKRLAPASTDDALTRTIQWIQSLEEQTDHWDFDLTQQCHSAIAHLHGSDDQHQILLARELAKQLQLDHVVFDSCDISASTGIRDGKPFEDYLCRRRHSSSSRTTGKRQLKSDRFTQMVVVADLDLVYTQDRFYSALNAFVRQLSADSINKTLILLLSQSCTKVLARHVSFIPDLGSTNPPAPLLSMAMTNNATSKASLTDHCTCTNARHDLNEAMHLSDLCWLEDYSLFGSHLQFIQDDLPVSCIPHDHHAHQSSSNALIERIEKARRHQTIISHMPSSSQWAVDLLPYWMEMERAFLADPLCRFRMTSSNSRSTRLRPLARHQRHYLSQPHPFL